MKIRNSKRDEKIELQMTPMIDIVFQLLVFFIMTFKIVDTEGDFNIRMPPPGSSASADLPEIPPIRLTMAAGAEGSLASLKLGDETLDGGEDSSPFDQLRARVISMVDDEGGPGQAQDLEIELQCDYDLDYENVIRAITSVSGYIKNGQRIKLIEKIKFAPPRE